MSFRRIFNPTVEEQIESIKMLIKLHKKQLGHCSTCIFHIPTDMPGFVTDYGSCRANNPIFSEKVSGLKQIRCSFYAEDVSKINQLQKTLKGLEGAANEKNTKSY